MNIGRWVGNRIEDLTGQRHDITPGFNLGRRNNNSGLQIVPYIAQQGSSTPYFRPQNRKAGGGGITDVVGSVVSNSGGGDYGGGSASGGATSGGGGGQAAAAAAAEAKALRQQIAQYDQSIGQTKSAFKRLGIGQQSAGTKIGSSYDNAINQLLLGYNQQNKAYNTATQQSQTDFVGAKNTIGSQAGSTLSGIRRLLGSRGAGGGSAYNITAPGAVTRQATLARQGATDTFGKNRQSLDTNWGNWMTGYKNEKESVKNQKDDQLRELADQTNASRGDLLQTLANLFGKKTQLQGGSYAKGARPYLRQANQYLDNAATYKYKPITYKTSAYNAPDLAEYTSESATPTYQGEAAANDYISPYFSALLGKREDELAGA